MEKYIEIIDAVKSFGTIEALRGISITVRKGEVVLIIGPSGSGKSTLLRCINRLEHLDSGKILIDGESVTDPNADIRRIREKVGMVFQSFNLFPHLTVLDNITLAPINVLKKSKEEAVDMARALLEKVGLLDKEKAWPEQLSGGQQQRVAIARALAMDPKVMLFDEPTSAMDFSTEGDFKTRLSQYAAHKTMVVVTHRTSLIDLATRIIVVDDGRIVADGPREKVIEALQAGRVGRRGQ